MGEQNNSTHEIIAIYSYIWKLTMPLISVQLILT